MSLHSMTLATLASTPPPLNTLQIKGYPSLKVVHKAEEYKAFKGSRDLDSLKAFVDEAAADLTFES